MSLSENETKTHKILDILAPRSTFPVIGDSRKNLPRIGYEGIVSFYRQKLYPLSINNYLDEIIKLVDDNKIVELSGGTGTGKSLGLPYALSENPKNKIIIAEPSYFAAKSLYESLIKILPGRVGYAGIHKSYRENNQIVYVTYDYLKKKLLTPLGLNNFNILILDEGHNQNGDIPIILGLWAFLSKNVHPKNMIDNSLMKNKLIITTIFPSNNDFSDITDRVGRFQIPDERIFKLNYYWAERDFENEYQAIDDMVLTMKNILETTKKYTGDIIIFLSSPKVVEKFYQKIKNIDDILVIIIHQYSDPSQHQNLRNISEKRKVILTTSLMEHSITVLNIGYVIDSMYQSVTDRGKRYTYLISRESSSQRAGRTGRTMDGNYYPMITEEKYNQLTDINSYDLYDKSIESISLELYLHGFNPEDILKKYFGSVLLVEAKKNINDLKLIDNDGNLSPAGKFSIDIPLAIHSSVFIYQWLENKYLPLTGIIIASVINNLHESFILTRKIKNPEKYIGEDDLETFLNIWEDYYQNTNLINPRNDSDYKLIRRFCQDKFKYGAIMDLLLIINNLIHHMKIKNNKEQYSSSRAYELAHPILSDIYSKNYLTKREKSYVSRDNIHYYLDRHADPSMIEKYQNITAIKIREKSIKNGVIRLVNFAIKNGRIKKISGRSYDKNRRFDLKSVFETKNKDDSDSEELSD